MMPRICKVIGLAALFSLTSAPFVYAICRGTWTQVFYYTGCDSSVQNVGESLRACEPIDDYEIGQQNGNWKEVYDGQCLNFQGYQCYQEAPSVSYFKKCNGSWTSASETDFNNGNCQCP
jgi:hypothetical protein